jgi:hypothetical protein
MFQSFKVESKVKNPAQAKRRLERGTLEFLSPLELRLHLEVFYATVGTASG